jgi:hypothetical protein
VRLEELDVVSDGLFYAVIFRKLLVIGEKELRRWGKERLGGVFGIVLFNGSEILAVGVDAEVLLDGAVQGGIVECGHSAVWCYHEVSFCISIRSDFLDLFV